LYRFFSFCALLDSATSTARSDDFTLTTSARALHIRCTGRWWVDYVLLLLLIEDNIRDDVMVVVTVIWRRSCVVPTIHRDDTHSDVRVRRLLFYWCRTDAVSPARQSPTVRTWRQVNLFICSVSDFWRSSGYLQFQHQIHKIQHKISVSKSLSLKAATTSREWHC